ncbi:MAG: hypothetical protein JXR48_12360 [Candidatus Delongbacteria bacterium]|nr:hypothetical protein [Candidatus Delongbacteria bacterium]MBN2835745.1 hypothetical protein [Candidatus Delongbacteria bacterium]
MKKILFILMVIIFAYSCNKKSSVTVNLINGETIYSNNVATSCDTTFAKMNTIMDIKLADLDLNEFFPTNIIDDKIILLSYSKGEIVFLGLDGAILKRFGGTGVGPGEIKQPQCAYQFHDTLFVVSVNTKTINKYDMEGNFLFRIHPKNILANEGIVINDTLFAGINKLYSRDEKGNYISNQLGVFDPNFKNVINYGDAVISRWRKTDNLLKMYPVFTASEVTNEIAYSELSNTKYSIVVKNISSNSSYKIYRNYAKSPLTESEIEACFNFYKRSIPELELNDIKNISNLAVKHLYYDKYGNLLANYSSIDQPNYMILDSYKNGKFNGKLVFKDLPPLSTQISPEIIKFIDDKIIQFNFEDYIIKVFEYDY